MANGDRRNRNSGLNSLSSEEKSTEELVQTLADLNDTVCNISKLIQRLQRNINNDTTRKMDAISVKTLH